MTTSGTALSLVLLIILIISDGIHSMSPNVGPPLRILIVGAGPSGQLLSHLLLRHNEQFRNDDNESKAVVSGRQFLVTMVDSGSDPRTKDAEQRAYALGIGIRGRTAVRDGVDVELWKAIKERGYESE